MVVPIIFRGAFNFLPVFLPFFSRVGGAKVCLNALVSSLTDDGQGDYWAFPWPFQKAL